MLNKDPDLLAAVDLGSNSFHLIISRLVQGELRLVDRLRERVCIAGGLDESRRLDKDSQERGLSCLERFGEQLENLPHEHVRAVGTNTFRRASNGSAFLRKAEAALGHPIEVISGQEEGRLIYQGVAESMPPTPGRRLVIDIGGGSTECILGEGLEVYESESLNMGCVSYSQRFFPDGKIDRHRFKQASIAAQLELQGLQATLGASPRSECLGSSGTIHAVDAILRASGWSESTITLEGLKKLRKAMIAAGHADQLALPELKSDRKSVLASGLAILYGAFESFGIESMKPASGALREGLLNDLRRRFQQEDIRDRTVRRLMHRYEVDEAQGSRVEHTALDLLAQVGDRWKLESQAIHRLLGWAARVHEIGMVISHSGFHKHGEYLLLNSDLAGFSRNDQRIIAGLVRCQRKKIPTEPLEDLTQITQTQMLSLCILLRLAILLHRTRGAREMPEVQVDADKTDVRLRFPGSWLESHPLSVADLEKEASLLGNAGYTLVFE